MGDRGNIKIKEGEHSIYIYTHWNGYRMHKLLQEGLRLAREAERLDHTSYANRILINHISSSMRCSETGMGVSSERMDNERHVIEWDTEEGKVNLLSKNGFFEDDWPRKVLNSFTVEEFLGLDLTLVDEVDDLAGVRVAKQEGAPVQ